MAAPLILAVIGIGAAIRLLMPSRASGAGRVTLHMGAEMNGHVLASQLPPKATEAREQAILALAESGQIPTPTLVAVTFTKGGHTVTIFPATDALMLGTEEPVRLAARHGTAQRLADFFGMVLPTSLMSDMAWLAATKVPPQTGLQGAAAGDTATFVLNSGRVDAAIAKAGGTVATSGLVRPTGKDWVNTERLLLPDGTVARSKDNPSAPAVANFGWHQKGAQSLSPGGQPVIQSVGLVHNFPDFVDYSQVVTLYGPTVVIDGDTRNVVDVLSDPTTAFLLSDEVKPGQAARVTRYPLVPKDIA